MPDTSAAGANPGEHTGTYVVTEVEVDLDPMAEGKRPMISFTGLSGLAADSEVYVPSIAVSLVVGAIPDLLTNSDGNSECISARYAISCQLGSDNNADGTVRRGAAYFGQETLRLAYFGTPTLDATGWDIGDKDEGNSNDGFNGEVYTYTKGVTRA